MKHLRTLVFAVVATGALLAFVGASSASATVLCSTTVESCPAGQKWPAGTILDFSLATGTSANLQETGGETLDTCKSSTVKGELTNAGSATANATGKITELTWGTCSFPTVTTLKGKLEIQRIVGTSNGTLIADEQTRVTSNTIFFGSCNYAFESGKSIGDITEGKPAVLHVNAVMHTTSGSELVCQTTAVMSATYTMTEPANTTVSIATG
jgi:hypothetical protein